MRRDGDETKGVRQRKRPTERRRAGLDERLMPKKRHPAVYTGIAFAILGGLMIASTLFVSWVDSFDLATNDLVGQLLIWDMAGVSDWIGLYYLALIAPVIGIMCAALSGIALVKEKRTGLRRLAAIGCLITSVVAASVIALLIWLLREEYISEQLDRSIYGPAIFLSVFGCVLAVAGGIVLAVDYYRSERRKGTFITAAGSKHLKTALKPAKRGHPTFEKESQDKEIRDEMLAIREKSDASKDEEEISCPNCQSPVKADWKRCPVCGVDLSQP